MSSPSAAPAPSKFTLSLGSKKSGHSAPSSKPLKRPHSSLLGAEEQGDHDDEDGVSSAQISSLGAGKTTTTARATATPQRVIAPIPNRDWREEASKRKRQRSKLPGKEHAEYVDSNGAHDVMEGEGKGHGLQIPTQTSKRKQSPSEPSPTGGDHERETNGESTKRDPAATVEDEEALAALTGVRPNNLNTNRIIQQEETEAPPMTDDEAFRHDFHSAPEAPTLDQYAATPIDGFGLALLRGYDPNVKMSDEGDEQQGPPHTKQIIQPRKDLLGLGAKEMDLKDAAAVNGKKMSQKEKAAEERKRRNAKKEILDYNPLARKNMKTGEVLDDEQLKIRVEEQKKVDEEDAVSAARRKGDRQNDGEVGRDRDRRQRDDNRSDSEEEYRRERDRQRRKEKDQRKDRYEDDRDHNRRRERDRRRDRDDSDRDRERRRDRESRRDRERGYDHTSPRHHHRRDRDREEGRKR